MNRPLSHRRMLGFGGVPAMLGASSGRVRTGIFAAVLPASALTSATARAGDDSEFWPELNAFVKLNPQVRLHFAAAYTRGDDSYNQALDAAGYMDVSLKPNFRRTLRQEDWLKNKYLWARAGYVRVYKAEGGVASSPEDCLCPRS